MKSMRLSVGILALGLITTAATPAEAAWNNVFQVTCWSCGSRSSSSYYGSAYSSYYGSAYSSYYLAPAPVYSSYSAPAAGCCDPCQTCTTQYVQRCYYQPVTTYQTQSYYEPVTSYVTKTYYEPVCSYRYSCYYDPCTCRYQQVATPVTSYVARQQCCPVQSWVQRCAQVPVTAYQKSYYWEPQTSCCTQPCANACPQQPAAVINPAPIVDGKQTPPPPTVDGKSGGVPYDQYYKPPTDVPQSQYRQYSPNGQVPAQIKPATSPVLPPAVKMDRIALGEGALINGQIVNDANTPKAGVQLIFVSAQRQSADKAVTTNVAGRFAVELAPGGWLVYVRAADGQQVYHSRVEIDAKQQTPILLVSR